MGGRTLLRSSIRLLTLLLLAICLAGSANALIVPPDLNPGDQYRLLFVTTNTDATSTDIADYNAFVTAQANSDGDLSALGTSWTAIASTATVDALDNTGTGAGGGVPIYSTGGALLFVDHTDLWDGGGPLSSLTAASGKLVATKSGTWTGTASDGTAASGLGTATPTFGTGATFFDAGTASQTNLKPLYAISGVLTIVPEPGTLSLVALGLLGYAASGRRFP